jgi:hypothetical protein
MKQIFSWLLFIFGEAILVAGFILLRGESPDNVLMMNIVVASIVYFLIFYGFRTPWIDLRDKSGRQVGSMGIKWFTIGVYALFAVAGIVCSYLIEALAFTTLLIIHCVLIFFMLLGLLAARHAEDKVQEVYRQQSNSPDGVGDRPLSSFVRENREQQSMKQ